MRSRDCGKILIKRSSSRRAVGDRNGFTWLSVITVRRLSFHNSEEVFDQLIRHSWFQTFAVFWMLYAFFWAVLRRLNFTCRRFGTLYLFHLHRQVGMNYEEFLESSHTSYLLAYEDGSECSETSAYKIRTPRYYPEESIQQLIRWIRSGDLNYGICYTADRPSETQSYFLHFHILSWIQTKAIYCILQYKTVYLLVWRNEVQILERWGILSQISWYEKSCRLSCEHYWSLTVLLALAGIYRYLGQGRSSEEHQ